MGQIQLPCITLGVHSNPIWPMDLILLNNFTTLFLDAPHVMISYQWKDKSVLLKVRDRLMEEGYKVWMNVDNMSE